MSFCNRMLFLGALFSLPSIAIGSEIYKRLEKKVRIGGANSGQEIHIVYETDSELLRRLSINGKYYSDRFEDTQGTGRFDLRVVRTKNDTIRFFNLYHGHYKNIEFIRQEPKGNIRATLYYNEKRKRYLLLDKSFLPYRNLLKTILGAGVRECSNPNFIASPISGTALSDTKAILNLSQENEFVEDLKKHEVTDESCKTGKFAASYENILHGIARVMISNGQDSKKYLACLKENKMSDLALIFQMKFDLTKEDLSIAKIHCDEIADGQDVSGSYSEEGDILRIHEIMQSGNADYDEAARQEYAQVFFHESIHRAGIDSEERTRAIEECCGKGYSENNASCGNMNSITDQEHKLMAFATSFAEHLDGFSDLWASMTNYRSDDVARRMFGALVDKIMAIKPNPDLKNCRNRASDNKEELQQCAEAAKEYAIKSVADIMNGSGGICSQFYNTPVKPDVTKAKLPSSKQNSDQSFCDSISVKLTALVKKNFDEICDARDGTKKSCILVAVEEAVDMYKNQDPNIGESFENKKLTMQASDEDLYVSLLTAFSRADSSIEDTISSLTRSFGADAVHTTSAQLMKQMNQGSLMFTRRFEACMSSEGGTEHKCAEDAVAELRRGIDRFFKADCVTYSRLDNVADFCAKFNTDFTAYLDKIKEHCAQDKSGRDCYSDIFLKSQLIAKNFDKEKRYEPFSIAPDTHAEHDLAISYFTALKRKLGDSFQVYFSKLEDKYEPATNLRILSGYMAELRKDQTLKNGDYVQYQSCLKDKAKQLSVCNTEALYLFNTEMIRYFRVRCPASFVGLSDAKDRCQDYLESTKSIFEDYLKNCPDSKKSPELGGQSYACIADILKSASEIYANFSAQDQSTLFNSAAKAKANFTEQQKNKIDDTNNTSYAVEKSAEPIRSIPVDFNDTAQAKVLAMDSYAQASVLSRVGNKIANDISDTVIPKAYAGNKQEEAPPETMDYASALNVGAPEVRRPMANTVNNSQIPQTIAQPSMPTASSANSVSTPTRNIANATNSTNAEAPAQAQAAPAPSSSSAPDAAPNLPVQSAAASAPKPQEKTNLLSDRPAKAKLEKAALNSTDKPRSNQTRVPASSAAAITEEQWKEEDLIRLATNSPKQFMDRIQDQAFLDLLIKRGILVIYKDQSYGSLQSKVILRFDDSMKLSIVRLENSAP